MKEQPETFWAYLAGFVEADGCIGLYTHRDGRGHAYTYGKVIVMQKDPTVLHWIVERLGTGSVCRRGKSGFTEAMHYVALGNRASREVCEKMLPYLVIKREKALKVLEYRKKVRGDSFRNRKELPEVIRLYEGGMSARMIAESMDLKEATVNSWLRKMGKTRTLKEAQALRRRHQLLGV